jgi:hypothetical protein
MTVISFASWRIGLNCVTDAWRELACSRFADFLDNGPVTHHLQYDVTPMPELGPLELHEARLQTLRVVSEGSSLNFEGDYFLAKYEPSIQKISIQGPLATYPVDLVMLAVWQHEHPQSLVFHASGLKDGDRGLLCTGSSGAGKSTISKLFADCALSDEFVAINLESSQPTVSALPIWTGNSGNAPLAAIFCLRHGKKNYRTRLDRRQALAALRGQVIWPLHSHAATERGLTALSELVHRIPVYDLAFTPDPTVWNTLTKI